MTNAPDTIGTVADLVRLQPGLIENLAADLALPGLASANPEQAAFRGVDRHASCQEPAAFEQAISWHHRGPHQDRQWTWLFNATVSATCRMLEAGPRMATYWLIPWPADKPPGGTK